MSQMSETTQHTTERPFTGWHMLALIVGFFAVVISVNVTMAVFATGSWTGLVVENSYVASQKYNQVLKDARAQDGLGWSSTLEHSADGMAFTLKTRADEPVAGARVAAQAARPVGTVQDRAIELHESAPGVYRSNEVLAPGIWNIEITAQTGSDTPYRQIFRLEVEARS